LLRTKEQLQVLPCFHNLKNIVSGTFWEVMVVWEREGAVKGSSDRARTVPTVIIEKSALFRVGLMHTLSGTRFRVTADCSDLRELPSNFLNGRECLAVIGLDCDAVATMAQVCELRTRHQYLHVVMLSGRFDPEEMLAAFESGGDGYLLKNEVSPDVLLKSLDLVLSGEAIVPQGFTQLIRERMQLQPKPRTELAGSRSEGQIEALPRQTPIVDIVRLSGREQAILQLLTQGASNKLIARELEITEATVKVHVKSLLRKLRAKNRTQAAMWAINHIEHAATGGRSALQPEPAAA
jgi:two-component system, NarL family, nitrate/nitrite response regulator NarL